jgi:transcriptional regulator with XRE-family HTH domain
MGLFFGERLKGARNNAGLTQQQLADLVGVKRKQVISNWEKGIVEPSLDMLLRLAKCLDKSLDYLLGHSFEPYKAAVIDLGIPEIDTDKILKDVGLPLHFASELESFLYFLLFRNQKDLLTAPNIDDEDLTEIGKMSLSDEEIEARMKAAEERDTREASPSNKAPQH